MIRENRAIGSLLDLLVTENDIMLKIQDAQNTMAEAVKIREGLQDFETAKIAYCREKHEKAERELDRLRYDLDEVRTKIGDYINYRYVGVKGTKGE